jgi:peptidoglycan/LPS O-acetylase OafA/YrhL
VLGDLPSTATRDGRGKIRRILRVLETGRHGDHGDRSDRRTPKGVRLPYQPGLDGLRAFAVFAVLLYHAELRWFSGGFLGVEIFFVISGYLITTLLLEEWRQRGRIDLRAFWLRRARRLFPALYLLLAVTLALAVLFLPDEVARLRGDALAAVGYVTNWYLVLGQESYFETVGRPSLLQHLWSLAIEEQFYVLWPLLFAVGMSVGIVRWRERRLLLVALVGAAASALLMASLYSPEVDPSRLYYGTDTRAAGLLIGVSLALLLAPWRAAALDHHAVVRRRSPHNRWLGRLQYRVGWTAPLLLDFTGLAALGGLVWFCMWLDESRSFLYQGGFMVVALTTAVLIAVVVNPRARLGVGLLGWQPLRWIGQRSYGIYLWHWPVFMVTRPELDVSITGLPLLALRLGATILLASLSYRYVETPIRTGALGRRWKALRESQGARRWQVGFAWAGALGTCAALSVLLGVALTRAQPPPPPSYLSVQAVHTKAPVTRPETTNAESAGTKVESTEPETSVETSDSEDAEAPNAKSEAAGARAGTAPSNARAGAPAAAGGVTALGDSVMVGAAGELMRSIGKLEIDAEVGRQAPAVIELLNQRRAEGQLGDEVVVHIGNNGTLSVEQFDEMMRVLKGVRKVVFVNVKVPRSWEQSNNDVLAEGVRRYPNAVLADWHATSANRPEFFVEDGYHLQPEGQRVYADLIAAQLESS